MVRCMALHGVAQAQGCRAQRCVPTAWHGMLMRSQRHVGHGMARQGRACHAMTLPATATQRQQAWHGSAVHAVSVSSRHWESCMAQHGSGERPKHGMAGQGMHVHRM